MVLTVTINPLLEKRFAIDSMIPGKVHRSNSEYFYAGGKGINVSRQLNKLGIKNQALLFAGGSNGKILRRLLTEEQIDFSIVNTKDETRIGSVIIEEAPEKMTTVLGGNSQLRISEVQEFKSRLKKMLPNCSTVIFSGSSPCESADDIYEFGIKEANELDKLVILDTYGNHLKACIDAGPMVIHNNLDEIQSSYGISLETDEQKSGLIKSLSEKGVKMAFLTDGKNPVFASKFGFNYEVANPEIREKDATGSGDAFVAGIAYGLGKAMVFEEFAAYASALGAANAARFDACNVSEQELSALLGEVEVKPIGKKMKIIDDSPTID